MTDAELIKANGGPTKLAEKLGFQKGGPQRVGNWAKRGIPPKVKLDYPDLFPHQAKKAAGR